MFWKKTKTEESSQPKAEKLPGPRSIEELVGREIVTKLKKDPDWVWKLRSVVRQRTDGKHSFDFRVFDDNQVAASKIKIKDYTSFDDQPELVLYEGRFDKVSMAVHFEDKPKAQV